LLKDNSGATINRNAYAYSPRRTHTGRGSPANTNKPSRGFPQ
jgi:hypothetical protein